MSRLEQLERLHAADATDADVIYMIAQEHGKCGARPAAIGWYDLCLKVDPNYVYAYFHKARVWQAAGDTPAALTAARDGLGVARRLGHAKAANELTALIEELSG